MKEMERIRRFFTMGCLAALAFLISCGGGRERFVLPAGEAHQALSGIDSLMWRQPDSAFVRFLEFAESPVADSLDAFDQHYCQLLISELLYKNDYEQSNREELLRVVDYLDNLRERHGEEKRTMSDNLVFLDARAHYMKGVGYYEMDSMVQACKEYLRALEVMEERFEEKELVGEKMQFMAMAYTRLFVLFSNHYLHEQAIFFGKCSLPYYKKQDVILWHLPWMLDGIGGQYHSAGLLDSAACYYQQAKDCLPDLFGVTYRDIENRQLLLAYKNNTQNPDTILLQLKKLLTCAESEEESLARCLGVGEIFYYERQFDSAWLYLDKVYVGTNNISAKKQAAEWMVEVGETLGKAIEVKGFADFLIPYTNDNENQGFIKSQLTQQCHEFEQWEQERLVRKQTAKQKIWGKVALGIVLLLAITLILSHHHSKRQQKQLKEQKETVEQDSKTKEIQHSALLKRMEKRMSELKEENQKLKENQISEQNDFVTKQSVDKEEAYQALLEEDICVKIMNRSKKSKDYSSFDVKDYKAFKLSPKELRDFNQAVERHCPGFSDKLIKVHPEINLKDLQLCRFYLLDLTMLQVAIMLSTDYSSIRKRTEHLRKKMGCKDLYNHLKSVLF